MHPLLLLAGAGAAALMWLGKSAAKLPPGQNPFDAFPLGVDGAAPLSVDVFQGSSGHRYTVTGFGVADGRTYFVATKKGDVDWLSYFVAPSGARALWSANADKHSELDEMKRDFQLAVGVT